MFVDPSPILIQRFPSQVTSLPPLLKMLVLVEILVQEIPSFEYAIGGPPSPTATQRSLFQEILFPLDEKTLVLVDIPVHVRPLSE